MTEGVVFIFYGGISQRSIGLGILHVEIIAPPFAYLE